MAERDSGSAAWRPRQRRLRMHWREQLTLRMVLLRWNTTRTAPYGDRPQPPVPARGGGERDEPHGDDPLRPPSRGAWHAVLWAGRRRQRAGAQRGLERNAGIGYELVLARDARVLQPLEGGVQDRILQRLVEQTTMNDTEQVIDVPKISCQSDLPSSLFFLCRRCRNSWWKCQLCLHRLAS